MRTIVIGDHTTCLAFSLGGIAARTVREREGALAAFKKVVDDRDVALVLITEKVAALIRAEVDEVIYSRHQPLVVEIPDADGPMPDRPSTREMMASLLGRS